VRRILITKVVLTPYVKKMPRGGKKNPRR